VQVSARRLFDVTFASFSQRTGTGCSKDRARYSYRLSASTRAPHTYKQALRTHAFICTTNTMHNVHKDTTTSERRGLRTSHLLLNTELLGCIIARVAARHPKFSVLRGEYPRLSWTTRTGLRCHRTHSWHVQPETRARARGRVLSWDGAACRYTAMCVRGSAARTSRVSHSLRDRSKAHFGAIFEPLSMRRKNRTCLFTRSYVSLRERLGSRFLLDQKNGYPCFRDRSQRRYAILPCRIKANMALLVGEWAKDASLSPSHRVSFPARTDDSFVPDAKDLQQRDQWTSDCGWLLAPLGHRCSLVYFVGADCDAVIDPQRVVPGVWTWRSSLFRSLLEAVK
jgi:hypothetical protein